MKILKEYRLKMDNALHKGLLLREKKKETGKYMTA
jgi:hypothetical protein